MSAESASASQTYWQEKFSPYLVGSVNAQSEQRGYCPIHEDPSISNSPSASFNFAKSVFYCASSCGGMSFTNLLNSIREDGSEEGGKKGDGPAETKRGRVRSIEDAPTKRGKTKPLPTEEKIAEWTAALLKAPGILKVMTDKRGLTKETLSQFEMGWDGERYTIPIRDADGVLVNIRRYDPNAKEAKDKMVSWGYGWGDGRLYGLDTLANNEEIVLAEGEMDRIINMQNDIPTVAHTSGASVWKDEWTPLFRDKVVFICYDRDDAGEAGAKKAAIKIAVVAKETYLIRLPGDAQGFDITDYYVNHGYTEENFRALMDESRKNPFGRKDKARTDGPAKKVSLEHSMSAEHNNDPLEIVATIAGKVQPSYNLPKRVEFDCDGSWGDKCKACPVGLRGNHDVLTIGPREPILMDFVGKDNDKVNKRLLKEVGAPHTCPRVEIDRVEQWSVEELQLMPSVDARGEEAQNPITRSAFNVVAPSAGTTVNTTVKVVGVNTNDPNTQHALLQVWEAEQTETDLDRFQMTPEIKKALEIFQVQVDQSPMDKMREVAKDLAINVTRIYGRPEMHIAYDLVWHSVQDFRLNNVRLGKGWLELLVVGDTRTGKSEAALKMTNHYQAGVLKSCEGMSFPGLVGGAQQMRGQHWMITWGVIPLNDRRLVVLDEFSGIADKGIIEQMSSIRSSGVAQITKIAAAETSARTRLIWISNPIDGKAMDEHGLGAIEAIRSLVKNPEDIARFDLAMSASRSDVDSSVINSLVHEVVPHRYTSALCSALVSWAWSRKVDQILWEEGTEEYVLSVAESFGGKYVPEPPLVQSENVRVKLARVAVAVAARTFSASEDGESIIVGKRHVDAATEIMTMLYGMSSFGYLQHSRKVLRDRERSVQSRNQAYRYLLGEEDIRNTLMSVLGQNFKLRDFSEFGGMAQAEAQEAVKNLQQMKMIERKDKGYMKMTPSLIEVLKKLESELDE